MSKHMVNSYKSNRDSIFKSILGLLLLFGGEKFEKLEGKGQLNNEIATFFFNYLTEQGIASHFVRKISDTEQLVKRVEIVPLEVVTRNFSAGSLSKRLGWEEGRTLPEPIVEF